MTVVQVVSAANGGPQVADSVAQAAGLADLTKLRPDFTNIAATRATFVSGVTKTTGSAGFVYEATDARNVWIVEYSGPPGRVGSTSTATRS